LTFVVIFIIIYSWSGDRRKRKTAEELRRLWGSGSRNRRGSCFDLALE